MTRDRTRIEEGSAGEAGGGGGDGGTPGKVTRSEKIQRRAAGGAEPAADALSGMNVSGGGAPLPDGVRGQFESSLGADLGGVRLHTGGESAEAARSLNAQAFTVGNDIHFGEGRFQPDDPFGVHLLAHEVAHTQQQAGGSGGAQLKGLDVSMPDDASEVEADRAADAMVKGAPAKVSSAAPSVQRSWLVDDEGDGDSAQYAAPVGAAEPAKKKPEYLSSYLKNRAFPWDLLQPEAKGKKRLTRQIIEDWIKFYDLVVYGAPFPDRMQDCNFNGASTNVNGVWTIFMQESRKANFIDDPFGAHEIISKDQAAKRAEATRIWEDNMKKNNGGGGGPAEPPKYWPGKEPFEDPDKDKKKAEHGTHLELEYEFTPITPKVTWGGHTEVEGPKHEIKGVFTSKVKEIGSWKAELTGSVVVEIESGKPPRLGSEIEGKLTREFLAKHVELELTAKMLVENKDKLEGGQTVKGHLMSSPITVKPSADLNLVYTIPGTKGMVEVKGGVSADPEGISFGAAFGVKWK